MRSMTLIIVKSFMYIPLYKIQIVLEQLHSNKEENNCQFCKVHKILNISIPF